MKEQCGPDLGGMGIVVEDFPKNGTLVNLAGGGCERRLGLFELPLEISSPHITEQQGSERGL